MHINSNFHKSQWPYIEWKKSVLKGCIIYDSVYNVFSKRETAVTADGKLLTGILGRVSVQITQHAQYSLGVNNTISHSDDNSGHMNRHRQ